MKEIIKLTIGGKPISEGLVLNKWFASRFNANKNCLVCIVGSTGCLSGETIIRYSRKGKNGKGIKATRQVSIKKLYNYYHNTPINKNKKKFDTSLETFIRAFNGKEVRLHKFKDVFYSGKKQTYKLILEDGKEIKATAEHKIMTNKGMVPLLKLKIGDMVLCDTPKAEAKNRKRIKLRDIGLGVGNNHPYNIQPNKQIPVHTLIFEARLNNMEFTEYLDVLLNEPERCKTLQYINPDTHCIHHKDGNHYNNSIENLQLLKKEEHYLKHNCYTNFSQGIPKQVKVKEIIEGEIEDVYDIECEEPYHNFVANDIIVHNSGKSYSTMRIAELWYWFKFKKPFPQENICFSIKEAMMRIRKGNLEKGEFIVIEEAGVLMNSLEFQNRIQRFFGWILQSFRCKNVGIIFNLPSFSMLNKTARILLHAIFLTKSVNLKTEESTLQCFYMKTDYISGDQRPIYFKHDYKGHYVKIRMMNFRLPSPELREKYEIKKNDFVDKTEDFLISEIEKEELEKDLKKLTPLQKATIRAFKNEDMEGLRKILEEKTPKEEPEEVYYVTRPVKDAQGKIIGYKKTPL